MPPAGLPNEQVLGEYSLSLPSYRRSFIRFHQSPGWLLRSEARASDLSPDYYPEYKTPTYHTKPIQVISIRTITGLSRPYLNTSSP